MSIVIIGKGVGTAATHIRAGWSRIAHMHVALANAKTPPIMQTNALSGPVGTFAFEVKRDQHRTRGS